MRRPGIARWLGVLGLAGALIVTSACSGGGGSSTDSTDSAVSTKPLRVFMSMGQTGLLAPSAEAVIRGAQAAIDHINGEGGINGRQIEAEIGDNQSDPTRGVTLVQDAIAADPKPDLVVTGVSSNEALAVAPVLARSEIVGMGPASSADLADPAKYPYFWGQSALQKYLLAGVADYLEGKGAKKIAFVGPDDALGDAINEALTSEVEDKGIEVSEHLFKSDAVDVTPAFQAALADNPDWIYMDAAGTQAGTLLSSRVKAGAEAVPTLAGVVMGSQPLIKLSEGTNQMDNIFLVMLPSQYYVDPADRSEQFNAFLEGVKAEGPIEVSLSTYAAGWDIIQVWADAVGQVTGEVTPQKVRDQLNNLSPDHDRLFYKATYPQGSNFPAPALGEFIVAKPTGEVKDGMFVIEK